jgi:hypothetical protein
MKQFLKGNYKVEAVIDIHVTLPLSYRVVLARPRWHVR